MGDRRAGGAASQARLAEVDAQITAATPTAEADLDDAVELFSDLGGLWDEADGRGTAAADRAPAGWALVFRPACSRAPAGRAPR